MIGLNKLDVAVIGFRNLPLKSVTQIGRYARGPVRSRGLATLRLHSAGGASSVQPQRRIGLRQIYRRGRRAPAVQLRRHQASRLRRNRQASKLARWTAAQHPDHFVVGRGAGKARRRSIVFADSVGERQCDSRVAARGVCDGLSVNLRQIGKPLLDQLFNQLRRRRIEREYICAFGLVLAYVVFNSDDAECRTRRPGDLGKLAVDRGRAIIDDKDRARTIRDKVRC